MTKKEADKLKNKFIIADFEDEGHRTYQEYEKIKKAKD
jgi:hypothetical protein|tara:strand:- start:336 stop:449 length:114 start_codon:yes stop_codon:yes gene_type:complete